jgi:hypothetical protein
MHEDLFIVKLLACTVNLVPPIVPIRFVGVYWWSRILRWVVWLLSHGSAGV